MTLKRRPGCCSCSCFFIDRDWWTQHDDPVPSPVEIGWVGDERLDVLGAAYYDELSGSGDTGMLVLPSSGAGVLLNTPSPFIDRGFVLGDILWYTFDPIGFTVDESVPVGTKIRFFFESDLAMNNYIYADCELKPATGSASLISGDYWIITLGQRSSSSDTDWDSWAIAGGTPDKRTRAGATAFDLDGIVINCCLTRQMCEGSNPPGCVEGYGAHSRVLDFYRNTLGFPTRNWYDQTTTGYLADPFEFPDGVLPGASIETTPTTPSGTYCGAIRLDSTATGTGEITPALVRFAAGKTEASLTENDCYKSAFSIHNLCKDSTPRKLQFSLENGASESRSATQSILEPRYQPISTTFGINYEYTSGGDYDGDGYATGDLIEQYRFNPVVIQLKSAKVGETDRMSRGEATPTLSIVMTMVQKGPCRDGMGTLYVEDKWRYEWDVEISMTTQEVDCSTYVFSLDPADATITELNGTLTPEAEADQITAPVEIELVT